MELGEAYRLREHLWKSLAVLLIAAAGGLLLYIFPINLGLDLQGGVHVVLQAQTEEGTEVTDQDMESAVAVIKRRVNGLGVAEPVVQRLGERRIIVELPGVEDQQRALEVIGQTALLEFQDPLGNTVLTGADLASAELGQDRSGMPAVSIQFTDEGAASFAELTTTFVGRPIPILLDGESISSPVVQEPIRDGMAQITGIGSISEARELVILLQGGSLPVPLRQVETRNIGPSLGEDSIDQSLAAGFAGAALLVLFLFAYYRLPGVVATAALAVYALLALGLLAGIGAVLTLPGIAGFILSVGMAVDANVIVYERVREELRRGKRMRAALRSGFENALSTILDANATTLIAAFVLLYFGTGPVRGFAVTLSIGIVTSMFTALVVTRWLLQALVERNPDGWARHFGAKGWTIG